MTKPTVHMNGTGADDLVEGFCEGYRAIGEAMETLAKHGPNGRDYYPQGPEAVSAAIAEHRDRLQRLDTLRAELLELAEHVQNVRPKPRQ